MTYKTEFPTMTAMPAIPADWLDTSWHNDVCPSFLVTGDEWSGYGVRVWVDSERPEDRECGGARFAMDRNTGDHTPNGAFLETDDWQEVLKQASVEKLAWRLGIELMRDLTPAKWRAMRMANRTAEAGTCASHDACDANVSMADAWEATQDVPLFGSDGHINDETTELWNAAWRIATPTWLTSDDWGDKFDAWRCTRYRMDDLGSIEDGASGPGFAYMEPDGDWCGFIEESGIQFVVNVANLSESFLYLADAERFLWHNHAAPIVAGYGHVRRPNPPAHIRDAMLADSQTIAGQLTDVLATFVRSEGLPAMSADELLHEALTPRQRSFVSAFYLLWEANERK